MRPAVSRKKAGRYACPTGTTGEQEFEDSQFLVRMFKHEFDPHAPWRRTQNHLDIAVVLTSESWGSGDEKLGGMLLSDFLLTLAERREKPRFVFLLHSAVKLAAGSGQALDSLKKLEALGVRILLSKTSLAHYKLEKEVRVGEVGTMMDIVNWLCKVGKVVTL
ncbi:MAG: hypothetical protein HY815_03525 [Candidatus Riflebacteria bacterium]|nr:hypothetical protein [Candidatus Riflebacteria bacterium]